MRQAARLQSARSWLETHEGDVKKLVKAYRKRYGVDFPTAIRELEMLGVEIDATHKDEVLRTVERQAEIQQYKRAVRRLEASGYDLDEAVFDGMDLETLEVLITLAEQETSQSGQHREKKKHQGHYCWRCGRRRANEKFSGKGHARHICKDCQKEMRQHARQKRKEQLAKQSSAQNIQAASSEKSTGSE